MMYTIILGRDDNLENTGKREGPGLPLAQSKE